MIPPQTDALEQAKQTAYRSGYALRFMQIDDEETFDRKVDQFKRDLDILTAQAAAPQAIDQTGTSIADEVPHDSSINDQARSVKGGTGVGDGSEVYAPMRAHIAPGLQQRPNHEAAGAGSDSDDGANVAVDRSDRAVRQMPSSDAQSPTPLKVSPQAIERPDVQQARALVLLDFDNLSDNNLMVGERSRFVASLDAYGATVRAESEAEIKRLTANLAELIKAEESYRANEGIALMRLSDALSDSSAGTWDEVFHAAESLEAEVRRLREALENLFESIASRTDVISGTRLVVPKEAYDRAKAILAADPVVPASADGQRQE